MKAEAKILFPSKDNETIHAAPVSTFSSTMKNPVAVLKWASELAIFKEVAM
jgi:hypothetical protein